MSASSVGFVSGVGGIAQGYLAARTWNHTARAGRRRLEAIGPNEDSCRFRIPPTNAAQTMTNYASRGREQPENRINTRFQPRSPT